MRKLIGLTMLAVALLAAPAASNAQVVVGVSVSFGPPALPVYEQPPCPAYGYIWTPGYWAWDPDYGYFWVPGTWVLAPFPGALWTPGYWAFDDGAYYWHEGYWGPVVGFYGGVVYGYGYTGYGYEGGYWRGGNYYYNRSVNNIRTTNITYVYNKTVVNNINETRVSFNGGPGGATAQPTSEQMAAARQRRSGPISEQQRQTRIAQSNPQQRVTVNRGRPAVAATSRPGAFSGGAAVQATRAGTPYRPPKGMPEGRGVERNAPAAAPGTWHGFGKPSEAGPTERGARPRMQESAPPREAPPQPTYRPGERRTREANPNVERQRVERAPGIQAQPPNRGRPVEAGKPGKPPQVEKEKGGKHGNPHDQ